MMRWTSIGPAALGLLFCALPANAGQTIVVTGVWSRPAIGTGVVYAKIRNDGSAADDLIGVDSPVCKTAEMHESTASMPSAMGSMPSPMGSMAGGMMMGMHQVQAISVPAHGSVQLQPGGYHIMLIGLFRDLKPGDKIPVSLHFRHAGTIEVNSNVTTTSP
ncbi:MAG TPA: copper chaperone PCu(A)C [Candidatus Binatia bacterium]|nr:copper chaperone PCu(A)C [Candidatus Binatia bacterium]